MRRSRLVLAGLAAVVDALGVVEAPAAGVFDGAVRHPKSGFVTLKCEVTDAQGNRFEQTLVRAYELR